MIITEKYQDQPEPGLIPTLRFLIALPVSVNLLPLLVQPLLFDNNLACTWRFFPIPQIAASFIFFEACALALLAFPSLPERLGRSFLPITLLLCTLGPLSSFVIYTFGINGIIDSCYISIVSLSPVFRDFWPTSFFLLIPLVIIAWQYNFRTVVSYAAALLAFDFTIIGFIFLNGNNLELVKIAEFSLFKTVVFMAIGYLVSRLVASQRHQRNELVVANSKLAEHALTLEKLAISHERNRMARDLHDTLAHYMSGLVLELEGTRILWESDETQARKNLDDSIDTARMGLVETRRALKALRASPLDDLGLVGAIREMVRQAADRNQWELSSDLPEEPPPLLMATEEALYRIAQEAVTNIERHAQADEISIQLAQNGHDVTLQIRDNGVGFQPELAEPTEHFGINGMAERAALVGGSIQVTSQPGIGTRVEGAFPLITEPVANRREESILGTFANGHDHRLVEAIAGGSEL